MSRADQLFIETCREILEHGTSDEGMEVRPRWEDGTPAHTLAVFGVTHRYDLGKEFPMMTLRNTYWKSAWDEISWIWQKKSNNIRDLKSHVWDAWADEEGTIGKAYGYQMGLPARYKDVTEEGIRKAFGGTPEEAKIRRDESGVYLLDQTDRVIYQLVNDPASRRILTNIYNIQDLSEMGLSPCAYSMTFVVTGNRLNAILNQRSQDMMTACAWNEIQYALITLALASAYGYEPGEFLHVIANCHIYDRHVSLIRHMIEQPQHEAPEVRINPEKKDFYDITASDILVGNYEYNPEKYRIPVAV